MRGGSFCVMIVIVVDTEFQGECIQAQTGLSHTGFRCVKSLETDLNWIKSLPKPWKLSDSEFKYLFTNV